MVYLMSMIYLKCTNKVLNAKEKYEASEEKISGTLKLLVSFLQIFAFIDETMDVPWAKSFSEFMNIFDFIKIDLSYIFDHLNICSFVSDFKTSFIAYMCLLPGIALCAWFASITLTCIQKKRYKIDRLMVLILVL